MRVLVVDDHVVVRAGLAALLAGEDGLEVAGEAAGAEEAVAAARRLRPDVVLMDLQLADGGDGIAAAERILSGPGGNGPGGDGPAPAVLMLTTYDADADVLRAVEAGASGYLLKACPPEELFAAVRAAARGESAMSPQVAARMMGRLMRRPEQGLSVREREVLQALARGLSNREIAKELFVSEATVKTHLVNIYAKLGVDSRTAAVAAAVERRLIRLG
ncbi:DNA-binding response regulator [Mangrovactinospora gilvigrisea]|uniref:DNA-binding response regulator n=1 Tax=Mangrovactinospora gilvigrisea TaxID=1428644 RepID=A0A1J7BI67_9ACTN|nr:DNA-binding response regulator [Mangrovactinospora gilvigrisea]